MDFALFPNLDLLSDDFKAKIPTEIPRDAIVGIAIGKASNLNMHSRMKIDAYIGRNQKVVFVNLTKYRDMILFLSDKKLKNINLDQLELKIC